MSSVVLLDSSVIDCIAAGEVLERPASCVKELLENSLDAGASLVQVDIEGGGLQKITVSDDGVGMSPQDVRMCVLRHATSKIRSAEDLFTLVTLGFRGEALSSIAGVSRLTVVSRRTCDAMGFKLVVEAGKVVSESFVGCPYGTSVEVADLFYQTPARLKFMKAPATEQAHVVEACLRVMLGSRKAGLVVTCAGRRLLDIPESSPESERILAALGGRVDEVKPFLYDVEGIRVSGYTAHPSLQRADSKSVWMFVNNRYVRDRMLQRAVLDGYREHIERGMYPFAVVYIDIVPQAVDVNVHPQKTEVRFSDSSSVFRAVSAALSKAVLMWYSSDHEESTPGLFASQGSVSSSPVYAWESSSFKSTPLVFPSFQPPSETPGSFLTQAPSPHGWRPLLSVYEHVWLYQQESTLCVVDTQAFMRRKTLRLLLRQYASGHVPQVSLLVPEALPCTAAQSAWMEKHAEACQRLGFVYEPVGPERFMVCAVPEVFKHPVGIGLCFIQHLLGQDMLPVEEYTLHAVSQAYTACVVHAPWPVSAHSEAYALLEGEDPRSEEYAVGVQGEAVVGVWGEQDVRRVWLRAV